ncbi:MAG: hypothetical protein GQ535_04070 [Rhodobacteraceae bacterium]|nr:hypothetical protein [Paracoccaceae bacterium]
MKPFIILITTALLTACSVDYQNTSGAAYLAAGEVNDPELRRAAAYEPKLHFPARIGVVKLVYNQITTTPSAERAVFAETLSRAPGEIVLLSALEARMSNNRNHFRFDQDRIRHLAASRHLDYVLIISYDPSQNTAEALFMDVRSGYPYASAETAPQGRGPRSFWGGRLHNQNRINTATLRLARALAPKIEAMLEGLIARAG